MYCFVVKPAQKTPWRPLRTRQDVAGCRHARQRKREKERDRKKEREKDFKQKEKKKRDRETGREGERGEKGGEGKGEGEGEGEPRKKERGTDRHCVAPTPDNAAALGMSGFWTRQVLQERPSSRG